MNVLIVPRRIVISKDIENLRKVEDVGRIAVIYHCSQIIYIKEGFLLDRRDSHKNRYYFEKNKKTIKKNNIKKRQRYNNLGIIVKRERI